MNFKVDEIQKYPKKLGAFHNGGKVGPKEQLNMTGSRLHCMLKSQLLLVTFYFVSSQFHISRARLIWYFLHNFNFFTNCGKTIYPFQKSTF